MTQKHTTTKRRPKSKSKPKPVSVPTRPTTYPAAAMSGPVAIDGVIYYVSSVPYEQFLDWRYTPLGHTEIDRILRTCRSVKIWFPKSDNLIATLERRNVGHITTEPGKPLEPEGSE